MESHTGLKQSSLAKIDPVSSEAFHCLSISRGTGGGEETERAYIDADDRLYGFPPPPNYAQNCAVASGYNQKIGHGAKVCDGIIRFLSSNPGCLFFQQRFNRKPVELLSDCIDQVTNARFPCVRDYTDRFRMHAKNSWFPSAPLIAEATIPVTTWPESVTNPAIFSCALRCRSGSRTIPPLPTSARCSSNCGLINARITPVGVIKSNAFGRIKVSEIKETSITQRSTSSGTCLRESDRALIFSRTITRGSLRNFQFNCP